MKIFCIVGSWKMFKYENYLESQRIKPTHETKMHEIVH